MMILPYSDLMYPLPGRIINRH